MSDQSKELAATEKGLALSSDAEFWTDKQLAALTQLGVERASNAELAVYHHVCVKTGLDPFARQIYMIRRDGKQVIQTGIDGYRLVAERAARRDRIRYSIGESLWCGDDGQWQDFWLPGSYPTAARVVVMKDGEPFPGTALWHEYVQTTRDNGQWRVTKMWDQRGAGQLAKCAEALALRKAFPQDLSGLYVDAEFDRADTVAGEVVDAPAASGLAAALADRADPDSVERDAFLADIAALAEKLDIELHTIGAEWAEAHDGDAITTTKDVGGLEILRDDLAARAKLDEGRAS